MGGYGNHAKVLKNPQMIHKCIYAEGGNLYHITSDITAATIDTASYSDPPTDAELDSAFGDPKQYPKD